MKWTYLIVCDDEFLDYDEIKNFLNARDDVDEWLHLFGNTFLAAATVAGSKLGDAITSYARKNQGRTAPRGRYLLTEVAEDRQGWIPKAAWNLIDYQTIQAPKQATALSTTQEIVDLDDEIPF